MEIKKKDWGHYFELSMSFFPLVQGLTLIYAIIIFSRQPTILHFGFVIFSIYLFPLMLSRLMRLLFPVREGRYPFGRYGVTGWLLQLKIQMFLTTFPSFERILHLIPGLYALWLCAWGSQIGKGVMWTPHVEVLDRGLIMVGDGVLIGHKTIISSHAVILVNNEHQVYCMRVKIGQNSLIGAESILGPGSEVGDNCQLNACSRIYPKQIVSNGTIYDERKNNA